jgi:hypothetical protein
MCAVLRAHGAVVAALWGVSPLGDEFPEHLRTEGEDGKVDLSPVYRVHVRFAAAESLGYSAAQNGGRLSGRVDVSTVTST